MDGVIYQKNNVKIKTKVNYLDNLFKLCWKCLGEPRMIITIFRQLFNKLLRCLLSCLSLIRGCFSCSFAQIFNRINVKCAYMMLTFCVLSLLIFIPRLELILHKYFIYWGTKTLLFVLKAKAFHCYFVINQLFQWNKHLTDLFMIIIRIQSPPLLNLALVLLHRRLVTAFEATQTLHMQCTVKCLQFQI